MEYWKTLGPPFLTCSYSIDLNGKSRTHIRAYPACLAFLCINKGRQGVPLGGELIAGYHDTALRTEYLAVAAPCAVFVVDDYLSPCHNLDRGSFSVLRSD